MPPINDSFANATVLSGSAGSVTFSNVGATIEAGEPANAEGHSVWFKWTPGAGDVYVRTGQTPLPDWDSFIAVFTGTHFADLVEVTHDDDGDLQTGHADPFGTSRASWTATGATYWIQVTAYNDVSGAVERSNARLTYGAVLPVPIWSSIAAVRPHTGDPVVSSNLVEGDEYRLTGTDLDAVSSVTLDGRNCSFTMEDPAHLRFTAAIGVTTHTPVLRVNNANGFGASRTFTLWFTPGWQQGPDIWSDDVREGSPNVDGYGLSAYLSAPNDSNVPDPRGSGTPGPFGRDNWSGEWAAPGASDNTFKYFMMFRTLGVDIKNLADNRANINFPYIYVDPGDYPARAIYVSYEEDGGTPVARGSIKFQRKVYMQTAMERESLSGMSYTYTDIVAGGHADVFAQHFHELVVPASMIQRNATTHEVHLNPDVWPDLSTLPVIATHPAVPTGQSPVLQVNPEALYEHYTDVEEDVFDYADHPQIMFIVVNEHHTGGAQLIAPPADGPFVGGGGDLTNYAAKTAQSDFVLTEGAGQQGIGNIFVLYTPPRYRFLYPVSRPPFAGASATSGVRFDTRH